MEMRAQIEKASHRERRRKDEMSWGSAAVSMIFFGKGLNHEWWSVSLMPHLWTDSGTSRCQNVFQKRALQELFFLFGDWIWHCGSWNGCVRWSGVWLGVMKWRDCWSIKHCLDANESSGSGVGVGDLWLSNAWNEWHVGLLKGRADSKKWDGFETVNGVIT